MSASVSPRSLDEAVRLLRDDPSLVPIAGCTDLMVAAPEQTGTHPAVIDLLRVSELQGIREREGWLEIGATTTFTEIRRSTRVRRDFPALAAAAAVVGGWQIQNRATLGGNIANASPAGDSLPALMALDAQLVLIGPRGERSLPFVDFYTGYRSSRLEAGELIGWVRLPQAPPGTRQLFRKIGTRRAQAISKVVVALVGRIEDGVVSDYRLAAGSVGATTIRFAGVEEELIGQRFDAELAATAGRSAAESVDPIDDVRSTATYRRFVLRRVVEHLTLDLAL